MKSESFLTPEALLLQLSRARKVVKILLN